MFYVYRHIRLDKETPFYVGKGKGNRYKTPHSRNIYWKRIVDKFGFRSEILKKFTEEEEAYSFEKKMITLYWRYGLCEANILEGGKGFGSGMVPWNKGNRGVDSHVFGERNGRFGKPVSEKTRKLIGDANRGRPCSDYAKLVASETHKGVPKPLEVRRKMSKSAGGRKFSVFLGDVFVGEFQIIRECARVLGISHTSVRRGLTQEVKVGGYSFVEVSNET